MTTKLTNAGKYIKVSELKVGKHIFILTASTWEAALTKKSGEIDLRGSDIDGEENADVHRKS